MFSILRILFLIGMIFIIIYMIYKLQKSPKFDKFCKDFESGETEVSPTEVVKDIKKAESDLQKKVKENSEEAVKLEKQSKDITKHLVNRGVEKEKKGESK